MRFPSAFIVAAFLVCGTSVRPPRPLVPTAAFFIIANQADGYGVDQCLAKGDKCGAHAARSYCQSREFCTGHRLIAGSIRKKITGSVPQDRE